MNVQCSGGSRSFAKGKSTLKLRSIVASHYVVEVDNKQWRAFIKDDALTTAQEVAEELNVDHSVVIQHGN